LDEEKSRYGICRLARENGFSPATLLSLFGALCLLRLVYKAQQTGAPAAREECNKYDLTTVPYFLIGQF
jgi:hypothetical protein